MAFDRIARRAVGGAGGAENAAVPGKETLLDRYAKQGGGAALPTANREAIEGATGASLDNVRVHTGGDAARGAASIQARAYTVGQDIHFADGAFAPGTPSGDHLIAHEVAHTMQGGAGAQAKLEVGAPDTAAERDADAFADDVTAGRPAAVHAQTSAVARELDEAQRKAAIAFNQKFCWSNQAMMIKVRAFFGCALRNTSDHDLVYAVSRYQANYEDLETNGKVDDATIKQMKAEGWLTKEWMANLDDTDRAQVRRWREKRDAGEVPSDSAGQREMIAACGTAQVGTVNSLDRGDGKKFGGERIKTFYTDLGLAVDGGATRANAFNGNAWSWCGIFATWCVKSITGNGSWSDRPSYPYVAGGDRAKAEAQVGDILTVESTNNHMALIVGKTDTAFICVGGNLDFQAIDYQTWAFTTATGFYRAVGGAPPPATKTAIELDGDQDLDRDMVQTEL